MLITTEQAKDHLKINATLNEANFTPFIPDAEKKFVKPFLGSELLSLLDTWAINKDDAEDPELAALYPFVVAVVARGTMFLASPHLDINVGESGFSVTSTNHLTPASSDRVKRFTQSLEELVWSNVENMLEFLEDNRLDYPEWVASDTFTMQVRNLINSAKEFSTFVDIDDSRLTFQRLRKDMDNVESIHVKNRISPQLFNYLIEKIRTNGELSDKESELLDNLRHFVANKMATEQLGKNTAHVAKFYYNEIKELINKFPDDFPLYRDSDYYDGELPLFRDYENTEDSSIFFAG